MTKHYGNIVDLDTNNISKVWNFGKVIKKKRRQSYRKQAL